MRFAFPHTATYWPIKADDGFGGQTFDEPITLDVRWQDRRELIRDDEGREKVSRHVVYLVEGEASIVEGGWMARGDKTATADPRQAGGAAVVQQVEQSSSLDGSVTLTKVLM